jgi:hypothetical protein
LIIRISLHESAYPPLLLILVCAHGPHAILQITNLLLEL